MRHGLALRVFSPHFVSLFSLLIRSPHFHGVVIWPGFRVCTCTRWLNLPNVEVPCPSIQSRGICTARELIQRPSCNLTCLPVSIELRCRFRTLPVRKRGRMSAVLRAKMPQIKACIRNVPLSCLPDSLVERFYENPVCASGCPNAHLHKLRVTLCLRGV